MATREELKKDIGDLFRVADFAKAHDITIKSVNILKDETKPGGAMDPDSSGTEDIWLKAFGEAKKLSPTIALWLAW